MLKTGVTVLPTVYAAGSFWEAGHAATPKGVVMPGMKLGFASERSIVGSIVACWPLIEPAASSSIVPTEDGARVRLPVTLMSPENAVTRSAPGMRPVWYGVCTTPRTAVHG